MSNFVLFLLALFLWAISLFLVAEAAKSQKWALGRNGLPDAFSGVAMAQVLSSIFILLWAARVFLITQPQQDPVHFISQLLVRPEQLTGGILLAVFPPVIVGLVKLITALVVSCGDVETVTEQHNRISVTSVYLVLHLIIGVASAVLVYRFFV